MPSGVIYIVMGVSGSGKTTMARFLAQTCGGDWMDADDFHSEANKARMTRGIPLTDKDRWPWLDRLNAELLAIAGQNKTVFLACSALKQKYRDRLVHDLPEARFVYLKGSPAFIHARLAHRKNHFMPAGLLDSQFNDLEEPANAIVLDVFKTQLELLEDFKKETGN